MANKKHTNKSKMTANY